MGQEDSKLATGFSVFQLHIGYGYIDMLLIVSVQQLYGLKNHFYTGACTMVGTVYPVTSPIVTHLDADSLPGLLDINPQSFHPLFVLQGTTCHVYFGKMMNATPNGRLAGRAISDGTSPSHGADTHGPSAVIKSLGKLDQVKSGGTLLNQRFLPSLLKHDEDIAKLASLIRSYFALGGHHIQFNIVDTATLHAAQKHPEEYRDLLVRVAGYSDYFNDMNTDLQYDVIARTAQETF